MPDKSSSTVYIGNLDERIGDRVLYDILIQAGPVMNLYIPRDKDTNKPKGYAFAEYETEEVAEYAVKLFSGLVTLYKRTLKFAISGQDKNSFSLLSTTSSAVIPSSKVRPYPVSYNDTEPSPHTARSWRQCIDAEDWKGNCTLGKHPPTEEHDHLFAPVGDHSMYIFV
ncbi:UNVERIFIED_CONTAM: Splicing factor 3B subunit [Sesamum latifolium]|uniref:Splicing factor 3B subunit n=1 Tax=Sesamum latifolium TaxID=2727402 RepID=A0AAW2X075_9LAMI